MTVDSDLADQQSKSQEGLVKLFQTIFPLLLLSSGFSLLGCGYSHTQLPNSSQDRQGLGTPADPSKIDYSLVQSQIFSAHCTKCHSVGAGNKGGVNLESYQNIKALIQTIAGEVNGNSMPPSGPLPDTDKALLNSWIDAGAPETVAGSPAQKPVNPTPQPINKPSPPLPCPDQQRAIVRGELAILDANTFVDLNSGTLHRRGTDCDDHKQGE